MADEPMQLDYARAERQIRSPFLGRVAIGCIVLSVAALIIAINFQLDWAGLIAYALELAAFVVSLLAIGLAASRTRTAWIAFWISLLYLVVLFLLIAEQ